MEEKPHFLFNGFSCLPLTVQLIFLLTELLALNNPRSRCVLLDEHIDFITRR